MAGELKVYRPGSKVELDDCFHATVVEVHIGDLGKVEYDVAWWDGRTRHTARVGDFEVCQKRTDKVTIGFKQ